MLIFLGTYCGVFRRKALDKGADLLEVDHVVTGHNADDVAETVLMNGKFPSWFASSKKTKLEILVLRGDIARLERCTAITTGSDHQKESTEEDGQESNELLEVLPRTIKRSKPFKYTYEKEIVMYAYFKVSYIRPIRSVRVVLINTF